MQFGLWLTTGPARRLMALLARRTTGLLDTWTGFVAWRRLRGTGDEVPLESKRAQHVVGEGEPEEHGTGLVFAAHGQLAQTHASRVGVEALRFGALPIHHLAGLARHAFAPIRHARAIVLARRVRIGAVLALRRRTD